MHVSLKIYIYFFLHFPTNGHTWDHLVSDLTCNPLHVQLPEFEKAVKVIECQCGRLSTLSPMDFLIVMLIKV